MLLDTLKEEESGAHVGDDLLKTMEEIAFRSASERREKTPEKWVLESILHDILSSDVLKPKLQKNHFNWLQ